MSDGKIKGQPPRILPRQSTGPARATSKASPAARTNSAASVEHDSDLRVDPATFRNTSIGNVPPSPLYALVSQAWSGPAPANTQHAQLTAFQGVSPDQDYPVVDRQNAARRLKGLGFDGENSSRLVDAMATLMLPHAGGPKAKKTERERNMTSLMDRAYGEVANVVGDKAIGVQNLAATGAKLEAAIQNRFGQLADRDLPPVLRAVKDRMLATQEVVGILQNRAGIEP